MILQQPPPFEPTVIEAIAITNIGFMIADILIFVIFIILMIYFSKRLEYYPSIITIYLFSMIIGFEGLAHQHTHFSPYLELFFILFQSSIFIKIAIDYYIIENKKRRGI